MIDLILNIHKFFYGRNELYKYKMNNKVMWLLSNCMSRACCQILCLYLCFRKLLHACSYNEHAIINSKIIVSLTSFPKRINHVWMVIDSLCRQTIRPQHINLSLSLQEFPNKERDLPDSLLQYKKYGLNIIWVENNLRPHNKYWSSMKLYPDSYIITVDDDIYYRKDLISHLWELSQLFPNCVCANNVTCILDSRLEMRTYNEWRSEDVIENSPSHNYIAKGYNGVIYPPHAFKNKEAFNEQLINKTCLRADDLWLKAQELINDLKVVKGSFYPTSIELSGSQTMALRTTNTSNINNGNDKQWKQIDTELQVNRLLKERVLKENIDNVK